MTSGTLEEFLYWRLKMEIESATVLLTKEEMEMIVESLLYKIKSFCVLNDDPAEVESCNRGNICLLTDIAHLCQHPMHSFLIERNDKNDLLFINQFIDDAKED